MAQQMFYSPWIQTPLEAGHLTQTQAWQLHSEYSTPGNWTSQAMEQLSQRCALHHWEPTDSGRSKSHLQIPNPLPM